jgi:competence protein ComEC
VLVDTGESPERRACPECAGWHQRLMTALARDVADARIDVVWVTHPHSDHVGGAADVLRTFAVGLYVDNGLDLDSAAVAGARDAARARGVPVRVVDGSHRTLPFDSSGEVRLSAIVPTPWPASCRNANDCSIGLRVDDCASSVLFVGDAESAEEAKLDVRGPATLLQVGHHGSDTSTLDAFVARVRPRYAVVSSAKPGEGTNRTFCHPRAVTLARLTRALGGAGEREGRVERTRARAFDGAVKCTAAIGGEHWLDVPASDRLWLTARDGDVVLRTAGDGTFERVVTALDARLPGRAL